MLHSSGKRDLSRLERLLLKASALLRRWLTFTIRLNDGGYRSRYVCESKDDAQRVASLWIKEAGTMRWIDSQTRPGDIFMDVGANIGIYTIAAAHRVGAAGKVYAFEPHKVNALRLMQNVQLSGLRDRVELFSAPLSDTQKVLRFNYASLASASSGSQFGHAEVAGKNREFDPVASEMAASVVADDLVARNIIRPPALIKIDVDGNELLILHGMRNLLCSKERPRSILVEVNAGQEAPIAALMAECGYELHERNLERSGEGRLARGVPADRVDFNAIYRPAKR